MTKTYQLPGLRIAIAGTPLRVQEAIAWLFQLCPTTDDDPELLIKAYGAPQAQAIQQVPTWMRQALPLARAQPSVVMVRGPAGESAAFGMFDDLLSCAWCSACGQRINVVCGMRNGSQTRSIIPSVLVPLLREALLKRGRLLLHAAAVRYPDGLGALLIAPSGGGKTTTTLSLVRLGAKLVADDLVVIDVSGGSAAAYGIPKPLNVREGTIAFFDELRGCDTAASCSTQRISVMPQSLYGPACLTDGCRADVTYFLKLTGDGPSVRILSVQQALERLILCHAFSSAQDTRGDSVLALCDFLMYVNAYELKTGQAPEKLSRWLLENGRRHAA